jgi:hypothetical protein
MERSIDTWIQRGSTAAMVALAALLIAVGITLYVPPVLPGPGPAGATPRSNTLGTTASLTPAVGTTHASP